MVPVQGFIYWLSELRVLGCEFWNSRFAAFSSVGELGDFGVRSEGECTQQMHACIPIHLCIS